MATISRDNGNTGAVKTRRVVAAVFAFVVFCCFIGFGWRVATKQLLARAMENALLADNTEKVSQLLDAGFDPHTRMSKGNTLLHVAYSAEMVRVAVRFGADVNSQNATGQTPLHIAAYTGNTEVAKELIHGGADIEMTNKWGETPLLSAATDLPSYGPHHNGILRIRRGQPVKPHEVAEALLKAGADPDRAADGQTPLHRAVIQSNSQLVGVLLEYGADVSAKTRSGQSPLQLLPHGIQPDKERVIKALLLETGSERKSGRFNARPQEKSGALELN